MFDEMISCKLDVLMTGRYFVWIKYDGTAYSGWQIQPNAITVQELLNDALATLLKQNIETVGAGRTDAGVHANSFAAHFDLDGGLHQSELETLTYKLNCILPNNIAVSKVERVNNDIHARFSAVSRTYHYLITTEKNPFLLNKAWFLPQNLDLYSMQNAAVELLKHKCFESFCKSNSGSTTYECTIFDARWVRDGNLLRFEISADRFLRNMVRAIVGTMVDLGQGKLTLEDFKKIIESRNRSNAGLSVPACGLYLQEINYPSNYIIVGNLK